MSDPQSWPGAAGPAPSPGLSRNAWIAIAGALAVIVVALAVVLISNNGGSRASGPSDEQQVQTAAQGFLTAPGNAGSSDGTGGPGGASGPVGGKYRCADADANELDLVGPYLGKIRLTGAPAVTGSKATISGTAVLYGQTFPVHVLLSKEQGTWCVTTVKSR